MLPGNTTPSATLTGLNYPWGLACDGSGNLYVTNWFGSTVSEFEPKSGTPIGAPGNTTPSATLTGLYNPWALAFDGAGNLYVSNWSGNTVSKFTPGSTTPSATLTGLQQPFSLAFDSSGNLFVGNCNGRPWDNGQRVRAGEHHAQRHPHGAE